MVRNFIWGGKDAPAHAKVKWDTLMLPTAQGGLGIIDPKTQSEALLAKLLIRGLALGGEPWKEFITHKADQIRLPVHSRGPNTLDVNWLFTAPKLKRIQCSMWKNIIDAWMKVRLGFTKAEPTNIAEIFRQPIFNNPSILNESGIPLSLGGMRKGSTFVRAGCTRTKDLWNPGDQSWKSLAELGMSYHTSNRKCKEVIIACIVWLKAATSLVRGIGSTIPPPPPAPRLIGFTL